MIQVGKYNKLKVARIVPIGVYLDDGKEGILLPKRFVPSNTAVGDLIDTFIYHDGEDRLIATTQTPKGILGDIVKLSVVSVNQQGAFLEWGLMKDLFVPRSQQINRMIPNGSYLVKIYLDQQTGRLAATEKFESELSNEHFTVKEMEEANMTVLRKTDIGYLVIINNLHTGVLHNSEVFRNLSTGDRFRGFIKKLDAEKKTIDVVAGSAGYKKVTDETDPILKSLLEHGGFLPYHDKSDPEEIYEFFGISKKTFKMAIGNLYKQKKISIEPNGIRIIGS